MRVLHLMGFLLLAFVVCGGTDLAGAQLAQDRLYSYYGPVPDGRLGLGLASPGDVDGDGVPDYVASERYNLRLFSGATGKLLSVTYPGGFDQWGSPLVAIGDLDGDGIRELAVGRVPNNPHILAVVSGSTLKVKFTITKPGSHFTFGKSVCGVDDVNGDGIPDLVVGEYFGTHPSAQFAGGGSMYVYSGANGSLLHEIHGPGTAEVQGLGYALADAGDFDGDGFGDFVAGTYAASSLSKGIVRIYSGATGSVLLHIDEPEPNSIFFGRAVAMVDDLNGDGVRDVVVGRPHWNIAAGRVYAYSGADASLLWSADGDEPGMYFGVSMVGVDDVDGDGITDVAVGTGDGGYGGGAATFPGTGYVRVLSGATGETLLHFGESEYTTKSWYFGETLAYVGDVNGDGAGELAVGERNASAAATWGGGVQLFSLRMRDLRPDATALSLSQGGQQRLRLRPGTEWGGSIYVLLGSASGIVPGFPLAGASGTHVLPLVFDAYTNATLSGPGPWLTPHVGVLGATGTGLVTLTLPPGAPPGLVGGALQHAFVLLDPASLDVIKTSNSAPLVFLP